MRILVEMLGLKDKPRSGRHADVPIDKLLQVRKELSILVVSSKSSLKCILAPCSR